MLWHYRTSQRHKPSLKPDISTAVPQLYKRLTCWSTHKWRKGRQHLPRKITNGEWNPNLWNPWKTPASLRKLASTIYTLYNFEHTIGNVASILAGVKKLKLNSSTTHPWLYNQKASTPHNAMSQKMQHSHDLLPTGLQFQNQHCCLNRNDFKVHTRVTHKPNIKCQFLCITQWPVKIIIASPLNARLFDVLYMFNIILNTFII